MEEKFIDHPALKELQESAKKLVEKFNLSYGDIELVVDGNLAWYKIKDSVIEILEKELQRRT